ncbi:conserved hypothetical protein [Ricinus communis]|uniref:Uncharacterized protein n=1 Tax=Ricinus communis TaxID=3988 RepID=B9SYA1_RICCO|nr:conserved hypothetical protein [Ricinus communis]
MNSKHLTQTRLAEETDNRETITVLVLNNGTMSTIATPLPHLPQTIVNSTKT